MDSLKINKVQLRNLQIEDYEQLAQSFTRVYTDGSDVFWTHKQIEKLIRMTDCNRGRRKNCRLRTFHYCELR